MTRDDAKQAIKENFRQLSIIKPDKSGRGFICPFCGSGSGKNGTGMVEDSRRPGILHCFNCGFDGDVFKIIEDVENVGYNDALKMAAEELHIFIDRYTRYRLPNSAPKTAFHNKVDKTTTESIKARNGATERATAAVIDYTDYYRRCKRNLGRPAALSYLQGRGISLETAAAYWIGFDDAWTSPTTIRRRQEEGDSRPPISSARIIIPVSKNHYIARAVYPNSVPKMNETGNGDINIFNVKSLYRDDKVIFITEGVFDALSFIEVNATAIALNSAGNYGVLLKKLKDDPTENILVIALDNDNGGASGAERLAAGLQKIGARYIRASVPDPYKDANEMLQASRAGFIEYVKNATEAALNRYNE